MDVVPVSIAVVAGGLAVVNPCGFPLLPAFLSFYLGADEERLPRAPTRVAQGLAVGALVTAGFLGLFLLIGLPLSYGVGAVAAVVPWTGLATGVLLAAVGVAVVAGRPIALPLHLRVPVRRERRSAAIVLFGVGYGAASLACTLPVLLALVGASLGAERLGVFAAYGAGMALVLMALSVGVALVREGAAQALRPLLPFVGRAAGALLVVAGAYLAYYWGRIRFGDTVTLADDPLVLLVSRFTARVETLAGGYGVALVGAAAAVVALAVARAMIRR